MVKALKIALFACLSLAGYSYAVVDTVTQQDAVIGPFGGLNTRDNAAIIGANQAQDLLNVDITPGGKSAKKRDGIGLDTTFSVSSSPVHGVYKFFDANGNEVRLAGQDTGLYASVAGASWVKVASGTLSATWQCTDWLGQAYCVTSSRDTPVRTDGTGSGTTFQASIPAGTCIASTADRLLVGNTAANPSRIYYSGSTNFTDFTLGTLVTSSSFEDITAPGSQITHLAYRYGYWMWWKDQSFGFMAGTDQTNLQNSVVSDIIGTYDNTDIFWQGIDYFRGSDSHIYQYDGARLDPMTRDITPTVQSTSRRKAGSWTQTTASDFGSGSSVYVDTTTSSGDVQLQSFHEPFADFSKWNLTHEGGATGYTVSGGIVSSHNSGASSASTMQTTTGTINYSNSTIYQSVGYSFNTTVANAIEIDNCIGTRHAVGASAGYCAYATPQATTTQIGIAKRGATIASGTSATLDTSYHTLAIKLDVSGNITAYFDGTAIATVNDTTFTAPQLSSATVHCQQNGAGGPYNCNINHFDESSSSGTYFSAVKNASSLTSWGTLTANQVLSGGSEAFSMRSSTSSFTVNSSTPAWTTQLANNLITISTGTFFQVADTFTITAATQTPTLNDFAVNWFEGNASDKMYGTYFDYGLWFAVSIGTATTNNRILRYDLLNQLWTLYDIPSNGFLVYNNSLYIGSPNAGKLYKFGNNATSDDGTAINAYWKSKDFFGSSPFLDEDMRTLSWYAKKCAGTTLSISYQVNELTTTTYSLNLYGSTSNIIRSNRNFPSGTLVNTINFQFGDNSTNPPWEVFAGAYSYVPRPWNVGGP